MHEAAICIMHAKSRAVTVRAFNAGTGCSGRLYRVPSNRDIDAEQPWIETSGYQNWHP